MRYVLWFWFVPMGFLWGWFFLSYHDISLGLRFFSRQTHDLVFLIYGHVLGMEKDVVVQLLVKACIVDTFLIMGILAFRRRKAIRAWWHERQADRSAPAPVDAKVADQVVAPAE